MITHIMSYYIYNESLRMHHLKIAYAILGVEPGNILLVERDTFVIDL